MTDYAFERWAASRTVSPELWRCVGAHPDERCLQALERALVSEDQLTRDGAALACFESTHQGAQTLLNRQDELRNRIDEGAVDWGQLAETFSA